MPDAAHAFGYLRELVWQDLALIVAIVLGSRILIAVVRWIIRPVPTVGKRASIFDSEALPEASLSPSRTVSYATAHAVVSARSRYTRDERWGHCRLL